ncbi:MAG: hypothetical protein K0S61_4262 [Anaerocolumna sp.]|jgi:hypothetical protein|nr:hypothetical protein [Anaerocolumna sp.]
MPKAINNIFANTKILITICLILALVILSSNKYKQTYVIKYTYDGIKYQSNNLNSSVPLSVEIDGIYRKGYFGNSDFFKGKIIVNGELCYNDFLYRSQEFAFNKYKMSQLESNSFKGHFFINDMFEEITIEIHNFENPELPKFNYNNGWLIAAPAQDREQAINVSNKLIQKLHKDVNIK